MPAVLRGGDQRVTRGHCAAMDLDTGRHGDGVVKTTRLVRCGHTLCAQGDSCLAQRRSARLRHHSRAGTQRARWVLDGAGTQRARWGARWS